MVDPHRDAATAGGPTETRLQPTVVASASTRVIAFAGKESATPRPRTITRSPIRSARADRGRSRPATVYWSCVTFRSRIPLPRRPRSRASHRPAQRAEPRHRARQACNHPDTAATENGRVDLLLAERSDRHRATSGADLLVRGTPPRQGSGADETPENSTSSCLSGRRLAGGSVIIKDVPEPMAVK